MLRLSLRAHGSCSRIVCASVLRHRRKRYATTAKCMYSHSKYDRRAPTTSAEHATPYSSTRYASTGHPVAHAQDTTPRNQIQETAFL
eukprot:990636-Rhodomonas_salina.1